MAALTLQDGERPLTVDEFQVMVEHKVDIALDGVNKHESLAAQGFRVGIQVLFTHVQVGLLDIAGNHILHPALLEPLDIGAVDEPATGMRLLAVVAILQRVVDNRAKGAIVHEIAHIVVIAQALHVLHVERHGAVHILVDGASREDPLIGIRAI